MYLEAVQSLRRRCWQWLRDQIAQDVPDADGLCEYDCRKPQCTEEEWATCERRVNKAAGELWPESVPMPRGETNPTDKPSQTAPQPAETDGEDVSLHHEIKCRAYELYEQQPNTVGGYNLKDKLQAELPRVAYAASQLQRFSNGEIAETSAVRAARVYLLALSSFIGNCDRGRPLVRRRNGFRLSQ